MIDPQALTILADMLGILVLAKDEDEWHRFQDERLDVIQRLITEMQTLSEGVLAGPHGRDEMIVSLRVTLAQVGDLQDFMSRWLAWVDEREEIA